MLCKLTLPIPTGGFWRCSMLLAGLVFWVGAVTAEDVDKRAAGSLMPHASMVVSTVWQAGVGLEQGRSFSECALAPASTDGIFNIGPCSGSGFQETMAQPEGGSRLLAGYAPLASSTAGLVSLHQEDIPGDVVWLLVATVLGFCVVARRGASPAPDAPPSGETEAVRQPG